MTTKHRNFTKALMHVRYYKLILHQGLVYFPSVKEHSVPKYSMKHAMGGKIFVNNEEAFIDIMAIQFMPGLVCGPEKVLCSLKQGIIV